MSAAFPRRLKALLREAAQAEALLVTSIPDIRWACGFTGSNAALVHYGNRWTLLTDGRYEEQAAREVTDARPMIVSGSLLGHVVGELLPPGTPVAVQSDHLTLAQAADLKELTLVQYKGLAANLRACKDPEEQQAIQNAQRITEQVLREVIPEIREGMSELELAAELVYRHRRLGASSMSFEPIVAFGENTALPHARPTTRTLRPGDAVLIDMGCFRQGYASDMTRMAFFGRPEADFLKVFESVRRALEAARAAARSGLESRELDGVARQKLAEVDLADRFTHSLGHGVGLEVHEAPPVSFRSSALLPEGAVITLEPGVYLPGYFGVRVEDMVALSTDGCRTLTDYPTDLIVL